MAIVLFVENMYCNGCARHVVEATRALLPDADVSVELSGKQVVVDPAPADPLRLVDAIAEAGYDARILRQEVDADFLARRSAARARLDAMAKPGRDGAESSSVEWFRYVYAAAGEDPAQVPWARLAPHPLLADWLASNGSLTGLRALDVGCGLGDNAEALAAAGAETTAFDYAARAIAWAKRRFPESAVRYEDADLFDLPPEWERAFDLVHECATLQTFTPEQLPSAAAALARLVAPRGRLLVITAAREEGEPQTTPWRPLTRQEIEGLAVDGLSLETLHDIPPASPCGSRLWRALLRRSE